MFIIQNIYNGRYRTLLVAVSACSDGSDDIMMSHCASWWWSWWWKQVTVARMLLQLDCEGPECVAVAVSEGREAECVECVLVACVRTAQYYATGSFLYSFKLAL